MSNSDEELAAVEEYLKVPDENQTKLEIARIMVKAPEDFGQHFASKAWILLATTRKNPFVIGDHPLAMQNMIDMGPRGNIGLAVKGIEIYFPLSPTRALGLWCPSIHANVTQAASTLRRLQVEAPHIVEQQIKNPAGIEALDKAMREGTPLPSATENVENFNSLQVMHAERYVFSSLDEFSLAREMIADNVAFRRGRRFEVN